MRLVENNLRCHERKHLTTTAEAEFMARDGKEYWICPMCEMEWPIIDKVFLPEGASAFKAQRKGKE
jgi:YHS domain-containing protein